MVNLVKVHAVELADGVRHQGLLVAQGAAAAHRQQCTRLIPEGDLHDRTVLYRHCHFAGGRCGIGVPFEGGAVAQLLLHQHLAGRIGHRQAAAGGNARIDPDLGRLPLHRDRFGDGGAGGVQRVFRRGGIAQVYKAQHQRGQGKPAQGGPFPFGPDRLGGRGSPDLPPGPHMDLAHPAGEQQPPGGQGQQHKADRFGQAGKPHQQHRLGAGEEFVAGAHAGIHNGQIQQAGQRQARRRAQQPPVAPFGAGGNGQQHRRDQIPLMHPVGHGKDGRRVDRGQGQRAEMAPPGRLPAQPAQAQGGQHDTQGAPLLPGKRAQTGGLIHPVAAQRRPQVEAVDGGIGIALGGAEILLHQPDRAFAAGKPRQHGGGQSDHRPQRGAAQRPQPGPGVPGLAGCGDHRRLQKAERQHRPQQQCLGLERQGKTVGQGRGQAAPAVQQPEAEHQRQHKQPVHLFPDGGVKQQRRAERGKRRGPQRHPLVVPAAAADPVYQPDQHAVRRDGQCAEQQPGRPAARIQAQRPDQQAGNPQPEHIQRGIIRKIIRSVKLKRPHLGHAQRPGGKAVHIVAVPFGQHDQHRPHQHRCRQHRRQRPENVGFALFHDAPHSPHNWDKYTTNPLPGTGETARIPAKRL